MSVRRTLWLVVLFACACAPERAKQASFAEPSSDGHAQEGDDEDDAGDDAGLDDRDDSPSSDDGEGRDASQDDMTGDADDAGNDSVDQPVERPRVLFLKVAFADDPFPVMDEEIDVAHQGLNDFYGAMSRHALEFEFIVHPEILETPEPAATYEADSDMLGQWIVAQAGALGFQAGTDYDLLVGAHPWAMVGYGGIAGGGLLMLNGWPAVTGSTYAHEMGHLWGHLNHAHGFKPGPGTDMFGTPGDASTNAEYGNTFDVMGRGSAPDGHFTVSTKQRLGWTDPDEVLDVTTSGTYRLYAHDNAEHRGRLLAIRVASENPDYAYWFEYRSRFENSRPGALAMFEGFWASEAFNEEQTKYDQWVLDATYGVGEYIDDFEDVVWRPGQSFQDKYGSAKFEILGTSSGKVGADSWVEVKVTLP